MTKIKVLLVDDEYLALQLLENFIKEIPDLELVDKVKSPIKAIEILNQQKVDLLFLDIQMPGLNGLGLLKSLKQSPITIFTTAYADYALDAFNLDAVDYLLKPFSFERFIQAVNKAKAQHHLPQSNPKFIENTPDDFIVVKSDSKTIKIYFDEILFVEGLKEYVKIVCADEQIVILESLKNLVNQLPEKHFLRVHKSYIINTDKVKSMEGNRLHVLNHKIPISRDQKQKVQNFIFKSNE